MQLVISASHLFARVNILAPKLGSSLLCLSKSARCLWRLMVYFDNIVILDGSYVAIWVRNVRISLQSDWLIVLWLFVDSIWRRGFLSDLITAQIASRDITRLRLVLLFSHLNSISYIFIVWLLLQASVHICALWLKGAAINLRVHVKGFAGNVWTVWGSCLAPLVLKLVECGHAIHVLIAAQTAPLKLSQVISHVIYLRFVLLNCLSESVARSCRNFVHQRMSSLSQSMLFMQRVSSVRNFG